MKVSFPYIKKILPNRIWHQVFVLLVLLVVIPLATLGILLIQTSRNAIKTSVLRNYKEVAIHATGEIKENIKSAQQALHVTASILGTIHANPWKQETVIVELALQYPIFQRISIVDLSGQETVSSKLGEPLLDQSQHPAFVQAKAGRDYISEVKVVENSIPFLNVAVAIQQLGKVRSILMAKVNLRGIWDLVDHIQYGKTGKAYLIDDTGRIIAHVDKKLVLRNAELIHPHLAKDIFLGRAGNREEKDSAGISWLLSYAPVDVKGLNWGLVIAQTKAEAYMSSQIMKTQSIVITFLSILAAIIISFILSRLISRPIRKLIQGTKRVAKGDFTHSLRIRRRDEIGRLLFAFNRMTSKLYKAQQIENLSIVGKAAAEIAHELKNSLSLVNTFVHLLPHRHRDEEFIKDFFQTISKEMESWKIMLRSMTDLARSQEFPMTNVNINDIFESITTLTRLRVKKNGIQLNMYMNDALPTIRGNVSQLKQVFLNLVTNALEATPSGGSILITTNFSTKDNPHTLSHVEVKIANTGKGITDADFKKIFEPFYTTKNNGLGLGLSISKEIIDRHGGSIDVSSKPNKGASFIVRIPTSEKQIISCPAELSQRIAK